VAKNEIDNENFQPLSEIDRVIHEPARLLILAYLSVVESADFLFLMNQTTLLSLTEEGRTAFQEYRRSMRQVLDSLAE